MISSPEIHVLLIDDFEDDRIHFEGILSSYPEYKFHSYACESWAEGMERLRERCYDCIVLDYNMPGDDGLAILNQLRIRNIHVPVVMLTGVGDERIAVEALKNGAQEYLPKGDANMRRLPNAILSAMERKQRELTFLTMVNNDSLTGVTSRHCLLEQMDKSIARADRNNQSLALMFIDIDDFKTINDTYGHNAGDFVLKEVAARLKVCTRGSDTLARLGGDEFVVLLENIPGQDLSGCRAVAARVVTAVNEEAFEYQDESLSVSVSIGIATYPQMAKNKAELIELADQAMYNSKKSMESYYSFAKQAHQAA